MEENSRENFILDTSAFLSLESGNLLEAILNKFVILTTQSVIGELEEFAQYEDNLGIIAKNVLRLKDKLKIKEPETTEELPYVGPIDKELFNLALKERIILITDDIRLSHHADKKINVQFSTIFLSLFIESKELTKEQALGKLEVMRKNRNWQDNIIYVVTKEELEKLE